MNDTLCELPCLQYIIDRQITRTEFKQILRICENAVKENNEIRQGKYFREVNYDKSYYDKNEFRVSFEIFAKGEYFDDRMLIYYHHYNNMKIPGIIYLDDHSQGMINLQCVFKLREYLLKIGAKEYVCN